MTDTIDWALAQSVARRISGTDPFAESYHAVGLEPDFERLTAEAQRHVEAEVGFASLAGQARARVVDRSDWVAANIASYQRLLRPVLGALEERMTGPVATVSGKIAGAEMGALLGWMSSRVLGQYDLLKESFLWPFFREAYLCALFAFTLNTGAYTTEILRGAIKATLE